MPEANDKKHLQDAAEKIRQRFRDLFPAVTAPPLESFLNCVQRNIDDGKITLRADGTLDLTAQGKARAREIKFRLMHKQN